MNILNVIIEQQQCHIMNVLLIKKMNYVFL